MSNIPVNQNKSNLEVTKELVKISINNPYRNEAKRIINRDKLTEELRESRLAEYLELARKVGFKSKFETKSIEIPINQNINDYKAESAELPINQNNSALARKNYEDNLKKFAKALDRVSSVTNSMIDAYLANLPIVGNLLRNFKNVGSISKYSNQLLGQVSPTDLMNVDAATNEALLEYFSKYASQPDRLAKLVASMGYRILVKEAKKALAKPLADTVKNLGKFTNENPRNVSSYEGDSDAVNEYYYKWLSNSSNLIRLLTNRLSPKITNKVSNLLNVNTAKNALISILKNGKLEIEYLDNIRNSILKNTQIYSKVGSSERTDSYLNKSVSLYDYPELKDSYEGTELPWIRSYSHLRDFEMSDYYFWGCKVKFYEDREIKSYLPPLNKGFKYINQGKIINNGIYSQGWWPIIGLSFTKSNLQSKNLEIPFTELTLPYRVNEPNELTLVILDDSTRTFRNWLDAYNRIIFDKNNNSVIPYKNMMLSVTCYQYDLTYAAMYEKTFYCIISNYTSPFIATEGHSNDEIELPLQIVGELVEPEKGKVADYPGYNKSENWITGEISQINWINNILKTKLSYNK